MRNVQPSIQKDLQKKFVFLAGPRQVGKTHLAKQLLKQLGGKYYNWDLSEDREAILKKYFLEDRFVVLDELHKYNRWKNFVKGVYDKYHEDLKMLVTGSARLDVYRRGGDSLMGRYFLFHLHPFSMGEVAKPKEIRPPEIALSEHLEISREELFRTLMLTSGFPEPFYEGTENFHRRWSLQRKELLVREDIRDLTHIHLLSLVEHLLLLLPDRVGAPLSLNSLREDLQVAYNTLHSWIDVLERLYIVFTLKPYTLKLKRSIHKERKLYFWDWSQVKDEGARFENFVASHLFKACQIWRDLGFGDFELFFIKDRMGREVDFLITLDHKPWLLVETKLSETQISKPLDYFHRFLNVPAIQLLAKSNIQKNRGGMRLLSADSWLLNLP